jgi:hypothetical protein
MLLSGASMATTRENTHASPRVIGDAVGGAACAIAELPSRSHEQKEEGRGRGVAWRGCSLRTHITALTHCPPPLPLPPLSAGVAACAVDVEVRDGDAGCSTQGPGLESQGADLNDADQAKCMPCVVM